MKRLARKMRPYIRALLGRVVRKHGIIGTIMVVGDAVVSFTKNEEDNKHWAKIRKAVSKELKTASA